MGPIERLDANPSLYRLHRSASPHETMQELGVLEARQRFPELLRRARGGEETLITRHGTPVAALVPLRHRLRPMREALLSLRGTGSRCWPERNQMREQRHQTREPGRTRPPQGIDPLLLPHGALLGLDASVIVPFLRDEAPLAGLYAPVLEGVAMGRWRGVLSMATLSRLIGGALAAGRDDLAERWQGVFCDPAGWVLVDTTPQVIATAARLEHRGGLAAAPALELASALQGGATLMISHEPAALRCGDPPLLPVLSARR